MIKFREFIREYLTDDQRAEYSKVQVTPAARKATDHFFGKDNDVVHEKVKSRGVTHKVSIVRGTEVGGQNNAEKAPDQGHPEGHRWMQGAYVTHALNSEKMGREYFKHEIKHGTVLVRVHDHNGEEMYHGILQPHENSSGKRMYALTHEEGVARDRHPEFTAHAHDVAARLSGDVDPHDILHKRVDGLVGASRGSPYRIHPKATLEHINNLMKTNKNASAAYQIASHPEATSEMLSKLASHRSVGTRVAVATHPNVSDKTLDRLSTDKDLYVRDAVAQSPNLTKPIHDRLLKDKDHYVRMSAIDHHLTTSKDLHDALKDNEMGVVTHALQHKNATSEHLQAALKSPNPDVQRQAKMVLRQKEKQSKPSDD